MRKYFRLIRLRKRKTLANFLLKNYVISFILMFFVLILTLLSSAVVALFYFNVDISDATSPKNFIEDNYKDIDASYITELGGYMAIVDNNNNIIHTAGNVKPPFDKKKLSIENINSITSSYEAYSGLFPESKTKRRNTFFYRTAYSHKGNFLMVLAIPAEKYTEIELAPKRITLKQFIFICLGIFLIIFLAVFYIYSRITSSYFLTPLKLLTHGANKLASGNYNTRINLNNKNEFKNLSNAFNIMASKIEEEISLKEKSEEARKRLILDISHDLKTPLASILGYSDYLMENIQLSQEEQIKYLSVIKRNSERANNLILDLFDYSKLDSWDFELSMNEGDICEFLRTLIASYIPLMEENGFNYNFHIPDESISLPFDNENLDRALSNLIINSTKYNPANTTITVSCYKDNRYINIIVEDDGIGIPKDKSESMFDPFTRGDESRTSKNPGTGLGLAITKAVILKHKGSIRLISDVNKGCKFIIKLPLKQ